jgi:hypothetical protein
MATKILVGETYMADGIDLIHEWSSVEEAWVSGRLDYLSDDWITTNSEYKKLRSYKTLRKLIEKVSYPFYFVESK